MCTSNHSQTRRLSGFGYAHDLDPHPPRARVSPPTRRGPVDVLEIGFMKVPLFDKYSGRPAGEIDIPLEVFTAAALVYAWMRTHDAQQLNGLHLKDGELRIDW